MTLDGRPSSTSASRAEGRLSLLLHRHCLCSSVAVVAASMSSGDGDGWCNSSEEAVLHRRRRWHSSSIVISRRMRRKELAVGGFRRSWGPRWVRRWQSPSRWCSRSKKSVKVASMVSHVKILLTIRSWSRWGSGGVARCSSLMIGATLVGVWLASGFGWRRSLKVVAGAEVPRST